MLENMITPTLLLGFERHLQNEERSTGTREKYLRDVRAFTAWLDARPVTKETVAGWKEYLMESGYRPVTINSMLSAIHAFFCFTGWDNCKVRYLKIQRRVFREPSKELTRSEYDCLLQTAHQLGRERLALLMETMCATGIRVSEVKYITVETAQRGWTEISLKGKIRTILLPSKLCRKLLKYAKNKKIVSGEIFLTKNGVSLSRKQIWAEMKAICKEAGVSSTKVFPHNLRHLFARTFYKVCRDVAKLADVLGHSSIETTRVYLISTGVEHTKQLERLGLVS